jgi:CubicO group peptidase (beta-lactamase class C family)
MPKNSTFFTLIKKSIRFVGYVLLAVFVTANLFIILSGRFYLYKGIAYTYLSGRTAPTIYDKEVFYTSTIQKSKSKESWKINKNYNTVKIPTKYGSLLKKLDSKAYLVFKGDEIISEHYWKGHAKETVSNSFSAAKTVVSLLIGIAFDEKKIKSLDEPATNYLPDFKGGGKEKITIRHLLMMSSGLDWQESGKNPLSENAESYYGTDLRGLVMRQHAIEKPGVRFEYQSGNSQLLGYIVEKATGMDLSMYAQKKIWDKIGSEHDAFWSLDKESGDEKSFCCMYATARDFGRLGSLILQKGKWKNQQIISEEYMNQMLQNPSMTTDENVPNLRYGLHIWTYLGGKNPVHYCRGILGQYIISIPAENIVIVRLGSKRGENYVIPEKYKNNKKFIQKNIAKIGHPSDLFELIKLGKEITKKTLK